MRLRRSGAALFRRAQAARLDRCGRGANAIADRATFLTYRDGYFEIAGRETDRRLATRLLGLPARLRALARSFRAQLHDNRGLRPPRKLRSLHRAVLRELAGVAREFGALADGLTLEGRRGDLDRYNKLEGRLLRELRFGEGPGEDL